MKPPLGTALAQQELPQKERPDFMAGYDAGMADARRMAQQGEQQPVAWYEYNQDLDAWFLAYGHNPKAKTRPLVFGDTAAPAPQAQQMEPTDDQLVKGVKAMRLFVTKNSVADFKLGYMAALAAAPAPQAQPVAQPLSDDEILTIVHRKATRYTHAVAPGQVTYGFTVAHLLDFANSIREVK